ncbi:hypothetical protein LCGC14_0695470 [marine sediment metagenome]|uniref:DUF3137 domain-containing protein n=1 Tax=marine sediment metagenome TaxID=412755 RepID=A0A0F9QJB4_9ZZZZ|nr:MAG: hypothetical protein Lokiarch_41810 [Candidatus Lokiarchaeum sp. GC14_75]HEC38640.1 hypothetical protein [bacterium]
MDKNEIRKLIILFLLAIIPTISSIILSYISTIPVTIIISFLITGILTFITYRVNNFYNIPVYIRKFKKLIYSNKYYNRITNVDNIVDFFKKDEEYSYFKLIFPIITPEVNPTSKFRLELRNKRFYEFLIYDNKLSLVKLNDKEFVSAKEFSDKRNAIVDKKRLKLFFKDLITKSKNLGTDYMDHIAEKKIDESFRNIANMIGDMPFM